MEIKFKDKNVKVMIVLISILSMVGCASNKDKYQKELKRISYLEDKSEKKPEKYKMTYINQRQELVDNKLKLAQKALQNGDSLTAIELNQQVLNIDVNNQKAINNIGKISNLKLIEDKYFLAVQLFNEKHLDSALLTLKEILKLDPEYSKALQLRKEIEQSMSSRFLNPKTLNEKLDQKISIEFKNAPVFSVLDVLAQQSGLNFILDKDAGLEQTNTTIFAKNTSVREALETILYTSSLSYKVLNSNTYLIYKKNDESIKKYDELITKSYYLGYADAQKAQDMIIKLYQPKGIFFDDRLRMLIIRDNQKMINSIDKLLQAYDVPAPEVLLDIEVLEVSHDNLLNLGIDFPNKIEASVLGASSAGAYTLNQLRHLNKDSINLVVTDPKVALNFQQTSNDANLLANPRIRIKSKEKAEFLIGDKVPVITTTTSELGGSIAENVSYLDVGLKLEVTPEVKVNREVQIGIKLEVSNIVKELSSARGLKTYQIGTRNASTILQLKDNETQMLAGLIKNDSKTSANHLPGFGKIPLLGRLFSSTQDTKNKSEIVLLITPKIIRPFELPDPYAQEYISGTLSEVNDRPLRLTDESTYQGTSVLNSVTNLQNSTSNISSAPLEENKENFDDKKPISLSFNTSDSVKSGEDLTVNIEQNTPDSAKISFDILHPNTLVLSNMTLNIPVKSADYEQISNGTRFKLYDVPKSNGKSVILNFAIPKEHNENFKINLENYSIDTKSGEVIKKDNLNNTKEIKIK
ncbi:hypothetical protein ASC84_19965 [Acinetobacter sp. Root1280]|nr:hypothetical protein ASC84_19965 [Acinetobacter sp. Root1280]